MTRSTLSSPMAARTLHSSSSPSGPSSSSSMPGKDFPHPVAVFSDRFCFTTLTSGEAARNVRESRQYVHPTTRRVCQLFTLDDQMAYSPFSRDYGPLNLAFTYSACLAMHDIMKAKETKGRTLCLYTSPDPKIKSNMALMVALYFLIVRHEAPWSCFMPIAEFELMPFRDAGNGVFDHGLNVQDCLYGMHKAMEHGLIDLTNFDARAYQYYETPENGDLNLLGPFIAFASPVESSWAKLMQSRRKAVQAAVDSKQAPPAFRGVSKSRLTGNHAFKTVLEVFRKEEVGLVVRLNDELYDKRHFTDADMDHVEMYFDDGSNPSDDIIREFIAMSERYIQAGRAVAVHCKAGLGRTGVLIGAYFIYKYGFTAQEVIGFMRIVRPGMVVGPQQQFMLLNQLKWAGWAARDELLREIGQSQPVNPLATPPAEISTFSHPHAELQSLAGSPKRGDAIGQPRKTGPVTDGPGNIHVQSPTPEPEDRLARNRQEYENGANREGGRESPADGKGSRGTKRGATRKPIPSADIPSTPTRLGIDLESGLERSPSILSVTSANDRPRKRINDQGSPLISSSAGYSSPPPSRRSTPRPDEMVIDPPSPMPPSPSRIPTKLLRREISSPRLRPIGTADIPAVPTKIPSSSSAPTPRSFLPVRKQTPLKELHTVQATETYVSSPSRIPRAVALVKEDKEKKAQVKEGWTPPRLMSMFYSMGRSGTA